MNVKRVLPVLLLLAGFAVPLQAQGPLPVHVICTKGKGTYKPICKHVKQAVNASPQFRQARSGNRYVVLLYAKTCKTAGPGGGPGCNIGDIAMSVTFEAVINDPLSHSFPYHIASIPYVFTPSESRILGAAIILGGLPVAVDFFSAVVDEINSYGTSGRELESTGDEILEEMKLEMDKILKEQTN